MKVQCFQAIGLKYQPAPLHLGVGDCDAKQLLRQLNAFFDRPEVEAAVASLPKAGEAVPKKMTDGGSDRDDSSPGASSSGELELDLFAYVPPGQAPPGFR